MTDSELKDIVINFRRGLLKKQQSNDMCVAVCVPLQGLLSIFFGINADLVEGDIGFTEHVWLKLPDGRILDPTADQFQTPTGGKMPKVYIGPKPDWYHLA